MKRLVFKKILVTLLILLISIPAAPGAFAAAPSDFVDFPMGWSNEAVTSAVNNGLLNGRSINTIEPESNLTRAEMAAIINRAFGATIEKDISAFVDVSPNEWYYHEIAKAYNMQTFQGDASGMMRPADFITREEVFAVIARALVLETKDFSSLERFNDKHSVSEWAKPYAAILVAKGYVNGDTTGNLNPLANITREEFVQIMHNIIKTYHVTAGSHNYAGPASTLIRTGGVTLSNVTVEGDLILGDGVGKGDVTLINVTIKGRLLARGGEGKVTLKNTTVAGGVVVKDVNGTVNFNNYRTEAPFKNIVEITKATFKKVSGGGGSYTPSTPESKVTYKVSFYSGPVADSSERRYEKTVDANTTMSQRDIDNAVDAVLNASPSSKPEKIVYKNGAGSELYTNNISSELWYKTSEGKWEIFDDSVVVKSNMNVFYTKKRISLFLKPYELDNSISFSVPYQSGTRFMVSLKDAMASARSQIRAALNAEDFYKKAIKKAADISTEKGIGIIDADGNIKFLDVEVGISNIIKPEEIDGEIEKYIRKIIVENTEDDKVKSAIQIVYEDIKSYVETKLGGAVADYDMIKSYIDSHPADREVLAQKAYEFLSAKQFYIDFINAFKQGDDKFTVTHENLDFVMAVATAVKEYTYNDLKDKIHAKFGKVIDVLGDTKAENYMTQAQQEYFNGVQSLWTEFESKPSDYTTDYPSFLTFKLNPIDDVFKPLYNKYYSKVVNKLSQSSIYHYSENTILKTFVESKTADALIAKLLEHTAPAGENTGYALIMNKNGESGFMHYYDYIFENLLTIDRALLWYGDNTNISPSELEEIKANVYENIAKILNKANEMLVAYETDGSLPMGKNISDLKQFEAFAKMFDMTEDKLAKALEVFKQTDFYGKSWTADSVKNDISDAEDFARIIFGTDEPVYNIDSFMDDEYVVKELGRAGFTQFSDNFDETWRTLTVEAIENTLKGNQIKIRRYYQK